MRNWKLPICLLSFIVLFSSCTSSLYYQVYKAVPSKLIKQQDGELVYEDENCKVMYNFWTKGGDVGFTFYNKKDQNIYINLEESFFIKNGILTITIKKELIQVLKV